MVPQLILYALSASVLLQLAIGNSIRDWKERPVEDIAKFSMLPDGVEYKVPDFDPLLFQRDDGAPFLTVALVDNADWINLALNCFLSVKPFLDLKSVTILTVNNPRIKAVFERLGFYVYDIGKLSESFPPAFHADVKLPNWSWGEIIFSRYNLWVEAFRRHVGFCSLDLDVAFSKNVLFAKIDGVYADISMQGLPLPPSPDAVGCEYSFGIRFKEKVGHYVNPGLACHSYNERTAALLTQLAPYNNESIVRELFGWGQQSYVKMFCENDFVFEHPNPWAHHAWQWHGALAKTGTTVAMFRAAATEDVFHHNRPEHIAQIPCFHAKACHGQKNENLGNASARVRCKEEWLQNENQWLLPSDVPMSLEGWVNMNEDMLTKLKGIFF